LLPNDSESLALARRVGLPTVISRSLLALAFALTETEPDRAAALLWEASTAPYESRTELNIGNAVAAHLGDWPASLRAASRLLRLDRRSGAIPLLILRAKFIRVARGLAKVQPEAAAVLLGAAQGLLPAQSVGRAASPTSPADAEVEYRAGLVRDATQLIVEALGETRMRELRSQGEAMDRDQASAYARTHIAEYLATLPSETT